MASKKKPVFVESVFTVSTPENYKISKEAAVLLREESAMSTELVPGTEIPKPTVMRTVGEIIAELEKGLLKERAPGEEGVRNLISDEILPVLKKLQDEKGADYRAELS